MKLFLMFARMAPVSFEELHEVVVNVSSLQTMLVSQKHVQSVAVMVLVVFTVGHCQENER